MSDDAELTGLAASGELDALEERWLAAFSKLPSDPDPLSAILGDAAAAIALVAERGDPERAASLLQVAPVDVEKDAAPEARLAFVQQLARHDPADPALRRRLRDAYRLRYKGRRGLDRLLEMAGLYDEDASPTIVNERLEHFMRYDVDAIVRHPSWGPGKIRKVDRFTADLVIDFESRKRHRMAPDAALETLELLDPGDFDARGLLDPDGLKELIKKQHLEALKLVIRSLGGKTNLNLVRDKLRGTWIPESRWSAWWNAAKKAAFTDQLVEVNEDTKPARLALRAEGEGKSALDEAITALNRCYTFKDRWDIAKRFLKHDPEGSDQIWDALEDDLDQPPEVMDVDSLVALTEARRQRDMDLKPLLSLEKLPLLLTQLPMAAQRELAELATTVREDWPDVLAALYKGDKCKIRGWVRTQLAEGDPAGLAELDATLTHDPMRNPKRYVETASRVLSGKWASSAAIADRHELAIGLLQLARQIENRKLSGKLADLPAEIAELLLKDDAALVTELIAEAPEARVIRAARLLNETKALGPVLIQAGPALEARMPDLELKGDLPFWQEADLLATAESIEKRRAYMIELMEKEMPQVEKAIGDAAAFGDLSENSEWTAAIERRNQLVELIERIKREVTQAQPLESQPIDDTIVCPGTRIHIRRTDEGDEELDLTILGPWDVDVEGGIVSYLSPLAGGLLGLEVGKKAWVELPEGRAEYEVLSIQRAL